VIGVVEGNMKHSVVWLGTLALMGFSGCTKNEGPPVVAQPPIIAPVAPAEESPLPDRSKLPEPAPTPDWTPPAPQISELSNGVRVWFVEQGPTPLVTVMVIFPHGAATDPPGKAGLTELTADMLDEGLAGMSALDIADELKNLATDYGPQVDVDNTSFYMNLMVDTLDPSLALLARVLREPTLPKEEFDRRREHRIAAALAGESEPGTVRSIVLRRALFGKGYNGWLARGIRPTLGAITLRDVKRHYADLIAPEGMEIVVVGGTKAEAVLPVLERHFGSWKGQPRVKDAAREAVPTRHAVHLADFPDAAQSALVVATPAPGYEDPDYFPAMIFNRSWGGAFTSRVNLNLREDKGYTYGTHSAFQRYRQGGMFVMAAKVKTDTTRASLDEVFKEVRDVCGARPLTAGEREEAVGGLLLGFPGRFQTINNVAWAFSSLPMYGRPADWFERWPDRVRSVTLEAANAVAEKYCDPKAWEVVVVGDRKQVEPTLEGLGMPVIVYDPQGNVVK
jgi:zinc protease